MNTYKVVLVEWLDICGIQDEDINHDKSLPLCKTVGIAVGGYRCKGIDVERFCLTFCESSEHKESDFIDIPVGCIVNKITLSEINTEKNITVKD